MRSKSPKKNTLLKPPSPLNNEAMNNLKRKSARWGLAVVSALLVLMQMSSSFDIYGHTMEAGSGAMSYDQVEPGTAATRRTQQITMAEGQSVSMDLSEDAALASAEERELGDVKAWTSSRQSHREAIAAKMAPPPVEAGPPANNNNNLNLQAPIKEIVEAGKKTQQEPIFTKKEATEKKKEESTSGDDDDDDEVDKKKPAPRAKPTNKSATGVIIKQKPPPRARPPIKSSSADMVLKKPAPIPPPLTPTPGEDPHPLGSTNIRRFGCDRLESPFVFVHIGKAGGGGVRARIAAASLDYNRTRWHNARDDPSYYYPMYDEQGNLHRGKLISSEGGNMLPHFPRHETEFPFQRTFRFEGSLACHATTPLGHAVACHFEKNLCDIHRGPKDEKDPNRCDLVYMGHNVIGGEMNFLPTGWLLNWWTNTTWGRAEFAEAANDKKKKSVATRLANRYTRSHRIFDATKKMPHKRNCADGSLKRAFHYNHYYEKCIHPETKDADIAARAATADLQGNWGPLYASMPIMRVTMLREPFSWLKSKFFWMGDHMDTQGNPAQVLAYKGDRVTERIKKSWDAAKRELYANATFVKCDDVNNFVHGWGKQGALEYIFYLCGEHCMGQWQKIQESYAKDPRQLKEKHAQYLEVMEATASYNLRNSFAVVGLLEETDEFFDMIRQRVSYMDTSLNPQVRGDSHSSGKGPEQTRCSDIFKKETFRREIMAKGPEIATAMRLYELGLQVNKFQKQELAQCSKS